MVTEAVLSLSVNLIAAQYDSSQTFNISLIIQTHFHYLRCYVHQLHHLHLRITDTDTADESLYRNKSKSCSYLVVTQYTTHVHCLIDLAK